MIDKKHLANRLSAFSFIRGFGMTTEMSTIAPIFNTNCPTFAGQCSLFHLAVAFATMMLQR
jgi:hypothetical protein